MKHILTIKDFEEKEKLAQTQGTKFHKTLYAVRILDEIVRFEVTKSDSCGIDFYPYDTLPDAINGYNLIDED